MSNIIQGRSKIAVDPKGRFTMPTRYKDWWMQYQGQFTITRTYDQKKGLLILPQTMWEEYAEEITKNQGRTLKRWVIGNAEAVEMDNMGRILLSPELREAASIGTSIFLIGLGDHFEIWNPQTLMDKESEESGQLPPPIPDTLKNVPFLF